MADYGLFFRPSGAVATRLLDRSVQLIELFLRILDFAIVSHDYFYVSLRTKAWARAHSQANLSYLDGMNIYQCLFDLLSRLGSSSVERPAKQKLTADDFIKMSHPSEQGALYLTPLIIGNSVCSDL